MKCRWNLTVDSTKQVLGGYVELTKEMTEKQMIAYVRKICRQTMIVETGLEKYGIWAEEDGNEDHSIHINASRDWKGIIDIMVYDAVKEEIIIDTYHDRLEKERRQHEEEMRKFEAMLQSR